MWDEKWKFGRLEWTEEVVTHRVRKINPKLEFEDLWNTLFADAAALVSTEEPSLQILVTIFNEVASAFGLTVSVEKSLILHQRKYTNKQFDKVKKEYHEAKKKKQEKKSGIY